MRSAPRALLPLVVVLACVGIAVGAYRLAGRAWDSVVSYETPYLEPVSPAREPGSQLASRTVVVIIDGLRLDASRRMSTLQALRERGADIVARTDEPSLSYPDWTAILSGATHDVHGVVTNWHEGAAQAETLLDVAERTDTPFVVVGPSDIATLYPVVEKAQATYFRQWDEKYMAAEYVDATIDLTRELDPRFVLLHIPDIDEAGHDHGGDSDEYRSTVARVDDDLRRLVEALQGEETAFVLVSDHGHIDTGGHGGWEKEVVSTPVVFAGAGIAITEGSARQVDVASTVALIAGLPVPRHSIGAPIAAALSGVDTDAVKAASVQRARMAAQVARTIDENGSYTGDPDEMMEQATESRRREDRAQRLVWGVVIALAALTALVVMWSLSWRALLASSTGAVAGLVLYNLLFFVVHGNRWSLSAFNSEELIDAWMNQRMVEAALAGVVAAVVAGLVYPLLRSHPKSARGSYRWGWLTLGPSAVLVMQVILALQVAWFVWWWGVDSVWSLPDLRWGFKFDLDLVQMTALGAAAVVAPLVTFVIGRYHPRVAVSRVPQEHPSDH